MSEDDYFLDLGYYVELLAIALTDIEGYVREESSSPHLQTLNAPGQMTPSSPKKGPPEKPMTELETLKTLLDKLHGKIGTSLAILTTAGTIS